MANQIQYKADQNGFSENDLINSIQALQEYRPVPSISVAFNVKGGLPLQALLAMIRYADDNECDFSVTLTATRTSPDGQMRLFGPGDPGEAVAAAERLIKDDENLAA